TEPNIQSPSIASNTVTLTAGQTLTVTLNYPVNPLNGNGIIRSDYPDESLRLKEGEFNVTMARIYLEWAGIIYRQNEPITPIGSGQTISISSLDDFTAVSGLPNNSDPSFGLYGYVAPVLANGGVGGTLPLGNIKAYISYEYPSPNTALTKISHNAALGCIPVLSQTIFSAISQTNFWVAPLVNAAAARAISLGELVTDRVWLIGGVPYRWLGSANGDDDGVNYIKPDAIGNYSGRFVPLLNLSYIPATVLSEDGEILVTEAGELISI
ncbi:MAG: hypothetical protein ACRC2V_14030, partial [Xenococcaceae cyanobacterium]